MKIFIKVLPLVLLLALPVVMQAQFTYTTNFSYMTNSGTITTNGTITITGYTGSGGAVNIPSTTNGYAIVNIGDSAFKNKSILTSVTIPDSIWNIGDSAFSSCSGLTNVTIPGSVININSYAFNNCTKLTTVTIANGVMLIGSSAFYNCGSLTHVTIPGSVYFIGDSAFRLCSNLGSVTISNGVTLIEDNAFWLSGLTSVTIPTSTTHIGLGAFAGTYLAAITVAPQNLFYSSTNGVLFDKNQTTLIQFPGGQLESYIIPSSVTTIATEAFTFSGPASVTIPSSVTTLDRSAFYQCFLANIMIPASVTNIMGSGPFAYSPSLGAITVASQNLFYSSTNGVLFDKNQTTLIQYPAGKAGHYTIPSNVSSISEDAFYGCRKLNGVTIPGNVTSIGQNAFDQCDGLVSVTIPGSITNIGPQAFWLCSSLTNVTISNGVISIGGYAFYYCRSLASIYFTGNVPARTNDLSVFNGDNNATVYYLPGTTGWGRTFDGRPTELWVPQVQASGSDFGVQTNQFGFNITWASGMTVVVEASTNLVNSAWYPISTNTLTNGSIYFSDPQWTNYPGRFYRLRSP